MPELAPDDAPAKRHCPMRDFARGFGDQALRFVRIPRMAILLAMLLALSWLGMDIYRSLVLTDIPVAVLDLDNSHISRTIREYLSSARELRVTAKLPQSVEEAQGMLTRGDVAAILLIPDDLSTDLKHGRRPRVLLAVDGSNIVIGKNVYKAMAKAVGTVAAGVQITYVTRLGEPKDLAMGRVVPVVIEEQVAFNPGTNYAIYVGAPLLFFLLHVFILLCTLTVLIPEASGVPAPPGGEPKASVAGRLLMVALMCLGLGLMQIYAYLPHIEIVAQSPFPLVLAMLSAMVVLDILMAGACLMVLPTSVSSMQAAIVLGMLSLMFSGATWPTDMFPHALQTVGSLMPLTPFLKASQVFLNDPVAWDDMSGYFADFGRQAAVLGGVIVVAAPFRHLTRGLRDRLFRRGRPT